MSCAPPSGSSRTSKRTTVGAAAAAEHRGGRRPPPRRCRRRRQRGERGGDRRRRGGLPLPAAELELAAAVGAQLPVLLLCHEAAGAALRSPRRPLGLGCLITECHWAVRTSAAATATATAATATRRRGRRRCRAAAVQRGRVLQLALNRAAVAGAIEEVRQGDRQLGGIVAGLLDADASRRPSRRRRRMLAQDGCADDRRARGAVPLHGRAANPSH